MRFLIYVPGDDALPANPAGSAADVLKRVGLAELAQGVDSKQIATGPDGKRGLLFGYLSSTQNQFEFKPEVQTWIPSAMHGDRPTGAYWIGLWNASRPTETDLRRPDHRRGAFVALGDGDKWSIVTPNHLDRFPMLKPDGSLEWVVDEKFNWLATSIDKRFAESMTGQKDGEVILVYNWEQDFRFMCDLLQINYRITPEVVSHLRLFSQQGIKEMIAALMGMNLKSE